MRCEGAQVEVCNLEGTGYVIEKLCATAALCRTSGGGSCEPPACETDAKRCTGAAFEQCNPGRTAWEKKNDCASEALCRADGSGDAGAGCQAPACAAGERHCNYDCPTAPGTDCIQKCKADRTAYETEIGCANQCQENTVGSPICLP